MSTQSQCACSLRTKLLGDGCETCNPKLGVDYLCERLERMARDCETSEDAETGRDGTFIPDVCSGFLSDDLNEAARLLRCLTGTQP